MGEKSGLVLEVVEVYEIVHRADPEFFDFSLYNSAVVCAIIMCVVKT